MTARRLRIDARGVAAERCAAELVNAGMRRADEDALDVACVEGDAGDGAAALELIGRAAAGSLDGTDLCIVLGDG